MILYGLRANIQHLLSLTIRHGVTDLNERMVPMDLACVHIIYSPANFTYSQINHAEI